MLLAVLGATDWIDGYVARRYHQVSTLGKVLDPAADRILVGTAVIAVIVHGAVPLWFGVATLAREVLVSVMVVLLAALGAARINVLWVGKAGTFALMFVLSGLPALLRDGLVAGAHPRRRPGSAASSAWRWPGSPLRATSRPARYGAARGPQAGAARSGAPYEGRDHGRRRGDPPAPPDVEPAQADAAAGRPADDGAHRLAAAAARHHRHRGDGRLPAQRHPQLFRRRLRARRPYGLRHRGDAARARPARCATPATS